MSAGRVKLSAAVVVGICATFGPAFGADPDSIERGVGRAKALLKQHQLDDFADLRVPARPYNRDVVAAARREQLQRLLEWAGTRPESEVGSLAQLRERANETTAEILRVDPPTPYEDSMTYPGLVLVLREVEFAARAYHRTHPNIPSPVPDLGRIVVGTRPSMICDVSSRSANTDEANWEKQVSLIEFNQGFFRFARVLSDAVARIYPVSNEGGRPGRDTNPLRVSEYLDAHPEIARDFSNWLCGYLTKGNSFLNPAAQSGAMDGTTDLLANSFDRSITLFALGHELGHVVFREVGLQARLDPKIPAGWQEELYCDDRGVLITMLVDEHRTNLEATVLGSELYFTVFDLVERGVSELSTGKDFYRRSGTAHPPSATRRERIPRDATKSLLMYWQQDPTKESLERLTEVGENLKGVVDALWSRIKKDVKRLHSEGVEVAPELRYLIPDEGK